MGQRGIRMEDDPPMDYLDEEEERFEDIDLDKVSQNEYDEADEADLDYGVEEEHGYGLGSEEVVCRDAAGEDKTMQYDEVELI